MIDIFIAKPVCVDQGYLISDTWIWDKYALNSGMMELDLNVQG